jgi:hypothetical protein
MACLRRKSGAAEKAMLAGLGTLPKRLIKSGRERPGAGMGVSVSWMAAFGGGASAINRSRTGIAAGGTPGLRFNRLK